MAETKKEIDLLKNQFIKLQHLSTGLFQDSNPLHEVISTLNTILQDPKISQKQHSEYQSQIATILSLALKILLEPNGVRTAESKLRHLIRTTKFNSTNIAYADLAGLATNLLSISYDSHYRTILLNRTSSIKKQELYTKESKIITVPRSLELESQLKALKPASINIVRTWPDKPGDEYKYHHVTVDAQCRITNILPFTPSDAFKDVINTGNNKWLNNQKTIDLVNRNYAINLYDEAYNTLRTISVDPDLTCAATEFKKGIEGDLCETNLSELGSKYSVEYNLTDNYVLTEELFLGAKLLTAVNKLNSSQDSVEEITKKIMVLTVELARLENPRLTQAGALNQRRKVVIALNYAALGYIIAGIVIRAAGMDSHQYFFIALVIAAACVVITVIADFILILSGSILPSSEDIAKLGTMAEDSKKKTMSLVSEVSFFVAEKNMPTTAEGIVEQNKPKTS